MTSAHRIVSTAGIVLVTAAVWLGSARPAFADSFVFTFVTANHGCIQGGSPTLAACPNFDGDEDHDFQLTGPDNGAGLVGATNLTDGFNDPYFTYSVAADAEFGRIHARAFGSYDFTGLSDPSIRTASAFAFATDRLTISADGLNGQSGTLDVSFLLDGTLEATGSGGALAFVAVTWGQDPEAFTPNNDGQIFEYPNLTVPSGPVTVPVNFVWGEPFYLSLILGVGVGTPASCVTCNDGDALLIPVTGTGSGTADFFNTLTLVGLLPKINGDPVLNAQFSSDSTTQYSVNGVASVPEPGSLFLLGTGLALGMRRWRRRHARVEGTAE